MKRAGIFGVVLGAVVWLGVPPGVVGAHPPRGWRQAAPVVSVAVQGSDGRALSSVLHHGQTFVAGEQGHRYELRITNNSADRIEVVVSVDGRDAVSGKMADFAQDRGYVIEPFGSVVVDGFRTSLQTVAAFRFSSPSESFAGRHGRPQNAGVIGVAVFKETRAAIAQAPRARASTSAPAKDAASAPKKAPSASSRTRDAQAGAQRQDLGTAFGENRSSAAREVTFVRARPSQPDSITTIRYDSAHALADRGIPIAVEPAFATDPPPRTWRSATDNRFANPPPPRRF